MEKSATIVEIWLPIKDKGFTDGYEISNHGRVRGIDRYCKRDKLGNLRKVKGRLLKPSIAGKGYLSFRGKYIHRFVVRYFLGGFEGKTVEVNHKDGNKQNNNISNLEAVSRSDNLKHSYYILGNKRPNQKLTKEEAHEIRRLFATGNFTKRQLGKRFGVSMIVINRIKNKVQHAYK